MALGPGAAVVPWCVLRASSATLLAARSCMADGWLLAGAVALLVATKASLQGKSCGSQFTMRMGCGRWLTCAGRRDAPVSSHKLALSENEDSACMATSES
jgi:hypothetical protein